MRIAGQEEVRRRSEDQEEGEAQGQRPEAHMTLAGSQRLAGRRICRLLLVALAAGATGGAAPRALASPTKWRITMTHANAFGQQASSCPGGKAATEPPCGIDPLTEGKGDEGEGGNGETFARESGWNEYKITVKNVGQTSA